MDRLRDSVAKAQYAVQMMRLARWVSGRLADDYEARVVGRMVLVLAPSYVECAFRILKRPGGLSDRDRRALREQVRRLRDDFDSFYERIRNDLSAHRDALDLDLAIEAWNEIDSDTLLWFCTAALDSLTDIAERHALMAGSPSDFDAIDDTELATSLSVPAATDGAARFSTDSLAMTRGEAGIVPIHPVQDAVGIMVSIRRSLEACLRINEIARGRISVHLLLKTMFVIDTMNLVDNLYGSAVGASGKRSPALLAILEGDGFAGAQVLAAGLRELDLGAVDEVRMIRNKACAHLDPNVPSEELQDMVLDLSDEVILDRVLNPSWSVLEAACAADFTTRWLLMDGISLSGLRPASTPGVRAFDREQKESTDPA